MSENLVATDAGLRLLGMRAEPSPFRQVMTTDDL
jgi:hypothetical protein